MTHATSPTLGDRLRGALVTAGLRQVDAAAEIGLTQSQLSRRLAGKIAWREGEAETLAALCGVPLGSLGLKRRRSTNRVGA